MYFEDLSGDEEIRWLSRGLPNMLLTDLSQTPGLDVVSSERIHEILKQVGEDSLEGIDKSVVSEIARRAGVGAVVVGAVFKSGSEVRIDVQVEDVGSGRILSAESVRGEDVFPMVDELTRRIQTSLNLGEQVAVRPIAEVTTPSLEAFRLYSEGLEARRNFRNLDARNFFEEAVKADPSFAMAYFELSQFALEPALIKQYQQKVFEHLDRLPERQRLLVQARYANSLEGNQEKAVELLESLVARYPDEEEAHHWLAINYFQLGQPQKTLNAYERGVKAVPHSGILRNFYGYQLLHAGRYPEAFREFETYAQLYPEEPNPHDSLAEAYIITGQPERAIEHYDRALEKDPDFFGTGRAWAYAMLGRYEEALNAQAKRSESSERQGTPNIGGFVTAFMLSRVGRYREANETLRQAVEVAVRLDLPYLQGALEILSALLALERENHVEVLEIESTRHVVKLTSRLRQDEKRGARLLADLLAGVAEVRSGRLEAARTRLESQERLYDSHVPWENWWYHALAGEIALAAGDLAAAESAFSGGEPEFKMWFNIGAMYSVPSVFANCLPFRDGRARVMEAKGDLPGAIEFYSKLNRPDISSKWTAILEPRYVLEVARLLDQTGDVAAARREYERFLILWENADPDLPELREARRYVQSP
jgi:tetratricopeptide (TPR) repeat protein